MASVTTNENEMGAVKSTNKAVIELCERISRDRVASMTLKGYRTKLVNRMQDKIKNRVFEKYNMVNGENQQ